MVKLIDVIKQFNEDEMSQFLLDFSGYTDALQSYPEKEQLKEWLGKDIAKDAMFNFVKSVGHIDGTKWEDKFYG